MKILKYAIILIVLYAAVPFELLAQERVTNRGTSTFRKVGIHRGNQVRTVFSNYGVIAQPGDQGPRGAWKFDTNGYVGDVSPLVGVKLPVRDYTGNGIEDTLVSVVITPVSRPGGGDSGPGGQAWGFEPIPGFANPTLDELGKGVAMSHLPETWPPMWPDYPSWSYSGPPIIVDGVEVTPNADWNGYFGRAQFNADQESYFWMDDNPDEKFFQRNGFLPDANDPGRRGHALQVSIRGLQWSNFLAQDVIFWLYNIKNDGTTIYDQAVFGVLVGTYVGAEGDEWNDDASFFDIREGITYTWDFEGTIRPSANPRWQPNPSAVGYIAYAFLESPGNPFDGIDNDGDNVNFNSPAPFFEASDFNPRTVSPGDKLVLIDKETFERTSFTMPNDTITIISMGVPFFLEPNVTQLVEGNIDNQTNLNPNAYDGIDNDLDGLIDENYLVHYRQYKISQTGAVLIDTLTPVQYRDFLADINFTAQMIDEARDDGIDNDGDWDPEFDDVGADGQPGTGDFGEGDGIPTPGEPNFDQTDVDESDQIGLTSFQYFVPAGDITMSNEPDMWRRLRPGFFQVPTSIVNNVAIRGEDGDFIYGSGYFPLLPGRTERFSLALAFGENFRAVFKTKRIAQLIYNANYNFPRPPEKPTLTAVPGDGKVTLYWDKVAENSLDPTTKEKDFEGYKIYKGTDPDLTDALQITNGAGEKVFYKPIAQFDLINGIAGYFASSPALYDLTSGAPYYLGEDNGVQNFYIDNDVINGKTYYYAVVAYDRGRTETDIYPSENTRFISKDAAGVISTDINTAAVVPNAPVIGYVPPESGLLLSRITGVSTANPFFEVIDPLKVQDSTYRVRFIDSLVNEIPIAYKYRVINETSGRVVLDNADLLPGNADVFNGVRLSIDTSFQSPDSIRLIPQLSGWNNPDPKNLNYVISRFASTTIVGNKYPRDYMLVFSDVYNDSSYRLPSLGNIAPAVKRNINFKVYDATDRNNPHPVQFAFSESAVNPFRRDTLSFNDVMVLSDAEGSIVSWRVVFTGDSTSNIPKGGDTLLFTFTKPLTAEDEFVFSTNRSSYDAANASEQMNKIRAVPNPYVVTNVFESPLPPQIRGRGERIINFVNLPPNSKIHIYTSSGNHIRTLEQDGSLEDGSVSWDIRTKEGLDVAYGVYFYVVEAEGISEKKFGKLAIIK
jgi:hypothetical protein